jgi:hypothetical protein
MITMKVAIDDQIRKQLAKDKKFLKQLPKDAYNFFRAQTPVKTGNARSRTRLQGDTIVADYVYAQRLDQGWSKQAPSGMTIPTERFIDREINKKIGK